MHYEIYKDRKREWRWRAIAGNGQTTATSHQSFYSKGNAGRAAERFHQSTYKAKVTDELISKRGQPARRKIRLKIKVIE